MIEAIDDAADGPGAFVERSCRGALYQCIQYRLLVGVWLDVKA